MSDRKQILRGTARASVGLVVALATAAAVVALGSFTIPTVEKDPPVVEVDTTQDSTLRLVCAGSFSLLGADVSRPEAAIPVGTPQLVVTGEPSEVGELERPEGGDGAPTVLTTSADQLLAAAQVQSVSTDLGRGVVASSCGSPVNDQWLLGGDTKLGVTTTLSIGNPTAVPATAQITVHDENGRVAERESAAVRVSPGAEVTVSINGYAPDRGRVAVHVSSTGAPVTASLGVAHVIGLDPFAVATVTRQIEPATKLTIPGVSNVYEHDNDGPGHTSDEDAYKVLVRVLAPGNGNGEAQVFAIDAKGSRTELGTIGVVSGAVSELEVPLWPEGANAVVIESDVPVIGGVLGSADDGSQHDYGWFSPAPELVAGSPAAAAIVPGGQLVLANAGDTDAVVEVGEPDSDDDPLETTVPAGAAIIVDAPENAVITSTEPIHAGVRYLGSGDIDGYPILAESQRAGALRVFVR